MVEARRDRPFPGGLLDRRLLTHGFPSVCYHQSGAHPVSEPCPREPTRRSAALGTSGAMKPAKDCPNTRRERSGSDGLRERVGAPSRRTVNGKSGAMVSDRPPESPDEVPVPP